MQQPTDRLLRIKQIVRVPKSTQEPLIDISESAFWAGRAKGVYPEGILISPRCRMWTLSSIQQCIADLAAGGAK